MSIRKPALQNWGSVNGEDIYLYHLHNTNGVAIDITNFGAAITSISAPDKHGNVDDIALGYDNLNSYVNDSNYIGSVVGRYANRINTGRVALDGQYYQLSIKPGGYHHHGGVNGFNKKVWNNTFKMHGGNPAVKLDYLSPDGEEGFPGNLAVTVIYTLNDDNQLIIDFSASTDKTTIVNLTQHSYFNLAGHGSGNIREHKLEMPLDAYLPVNKSQVPDGNILPVVGTPFDFRRIKPIGQDIDTSNEQLMLSDGYDHSWIIKRSNSDELKLAARVIEPSSGRTLRVYTTEPAIHLYTGNALNDVAGKNGTHYGRRNGFCLETQQYPDSPNHEHFPSVILRKDEVFKSRTIFEFGVTN